MYETKIIHDSANTLYVQHQESSFWIFCYNSMGDLFLNSDYGFYAYSWRAFGDDFKKFLGSCNKHYLADKLSYNTNASRARIKATSKHIENLCEMLITYLKEN